MDEQGRVLEHHALAQAVEVPPICPHPEAAPVHPGYWIIYAGSEVGADELGRGATEASAWVDAVGNLEQFEAKTRQP